MALRTTPSVNALSKLNVDEAALDRFSIYSIRMLAADMVDNANSGHLGAAFGCAPLANALWGKIMNFAPGKQWINRDRFVMSNGHASSLLYSMLHLTGSGLGGPHEVSMDALKEFRKVGSITPGHPEFGMTNGVEVTTGPLGQGFANAVGMAISEAHLSARFNRQGFPLFDHYTYVLAGDGCLMEGVAGEAASLAGHLQLHKLIVFYDDNKITIDGSTDLTFTEDVAGIFAARKWNVLHMPGKDVLDASAFVRIVEEAKSQTEKPTIIIMQTTIGHGVGGGLEGHHKAHGGKFPTRPLREKWCVPEGLRKSEDKFDHQVADMVQQELDELRCGGKTAQGERGEMLPSFHVPKKVLDKFRSFGACGDKLAAQWDQMLADYCNTFKDKEPETVRDLQNRVQGRFLAEGWKLPLQEYLLSEQERINGSLKVLLNEEANDEEGSTTDEEPPLKRRKCEDGLKHKAGRVCATEVLKMFVASNPSVIGGSGDVGSSCGGHFPKIQGTFLPESYGSRIEGASYAGRYINFGVREHACLAIMNGISAHSGLIPYCSLFTVFFQYGFPAMRMAALSKLPALYVGTHDSIDLGEDGPTHQPVEILPQLRAMPNLLVIRPSNVEEMVGAFQVFGAQYDRAEQSAQSMADPHAVERRPVFLMTSRGELGLPYQSNGHVSGEEGAQKGAYVIHECFDKTSKGLATDVGARPLPGIVLIASGQDVALAMKAKELLLEWSAGLNNKLHDSVSALAIRDPAQLKVRVVSMPCWELFEEQSAEYQESVLLSSHDDILRVYVEKAATKNTGHDKYAHLSLVMPSYGLSGKAADVERKLEFTPDCIASKVLAAWTERRQ